ncbi:MAG: TauD/TfdA family dioxygenase [Phenylobacterium sp.]|uniref:TauD/TfdA family dioxygenase n=1 Tax=Phenylobacterium sp. TaxID=1871053 RepID=UPI001A640600|nr:TauD/TfdA family dioxygenase [Phenylobacterium sp.]MBL8772985.1 TauD/TfdA family dioxygenase [Phenylobacterium sp.]
MSQSRLMTIAEQSAHFLNRPQGGPPPGPVTGAAAWCAPDLGGAEDWSERLSPELVAAVDAAMARVRGRDLDALGPADVGLEGQAATVARWRETLASGRGFLVLRGAPVERWDLAEQKLFMRVLGLQFGRLGFNNPQGDVIGEVRDTGAASRDPHARLYATSGEFRFHCDAADLVGLLCVRPAMTGGDSRIASSSTVYNELRRRRPDLAAKLFRPMPFDLRNEQAADAAPFAEMTPCTFDGDRLYTFYISDYFRSVERHGVAVDRDLLDTYDALAEEPGVGLKFRLEAGDIQILNNHALLHARTAFEDAPGHERLLLRFLVSVGA